MVVINNSSKKKGKKITFGIKASSFLRDFKIQFQGAVAWEGYTVIISLTTSP